MTVFTGQAGVVFGAGADVGGGRAAAVRLPVEGATVIRSDVDAQATDDTADLVSGNVNPAAAAAAAAVAADASSVEAVVAEASERSGQVRVVVHSVGITGAIGKRSHEYDRAEADGVDWVKGCMGMSARRPRRPSSSLPRQAVSPPFSRSAWRVARPNH